MSKQSEHNPTATPPNHVDKHDAVPALLQRVQKVTNLKALPVAVKGCMCGPSCQCSTVSTDITALWDTYQAIVDGHLTIKKEELVRRLEQALIYYEDKGQIRWQDGRDTWWSFTQQRFIHNMPNKS